MVPATYEMSLSNTMVTSANQVSMPFLVGSTHLSQNYLDQPIFIDSDQAYFWTEEWQQGEREADKDIAQGDLNKFKNVQDLAHWLLSDD